MILHDDNRDWQYDTIWHWPLYNKVLEKKKNQMIKIIFFSENFVTNFEL